MDTQLERIRKAYDLTVKQFRNGINPLDNIPKEIKKSPVYRELTTVGKVFGSGALDIKEYLSPEPGMRFLDAGCSANLFNYRLDKWPSTYYGVDISPALIDAMKGFVVGQGISIGGLHLAEITEIPFEDNFFDIAAVIGMLEYYPLEYNRKALTELNRVLKPDARVVLDIPNREHPYAGDLVKLEEHLKRPIYLHDRRDFENLLASLFSVERVNDSWVMLKYFLHALK